MAGKNPQRVPNLYNRQYEDDDDFADDVDECIVHDNYAG